MLKPLLDTVSESKAQLFLIPGIVDRIQRKESAALDNLVEWLKRTEDILQKFGFAQCAELAGLRSKLLTPEFTASQRASRKKEQLRIASEIIYDAQRVVLGLIEPLEEKTNEARDIINQILILVRPTGALDMDPSSSFTDFIQGVWHLLKTNEQVGGGIAKVLTLMNQADALRILAEEI